ncbi:MAG: hypothetical protein KDJ19_07485 [Hyphomicrobiaceae bacterium]|nr:hypothetical protein [Hyphomicrobiaceae bacterium]
MAIGSINGSGSAYTIGGRPLGVQLGQKAATDLIGSADPSSIIAANVSAAQQGGVSVTATDMIVKGIQDEIDRINGYRTNLSVAEKQKLADLQTKIEGFNQTAQSRSLTQDEITERSDLYVDAYKILGKDYVDIASDEYLTQKTDELTELMATKPKGADAEQLTQLETLKDSIYQRIDDASADGRDVSDLYYNQLRSITARITKLTAPRDISELSQDELRQHDEIADAINDHAGQEIQLKSDKRLQISRLQKTMELVQQGVGGPVNILA